MSTTAEIKNGLCIKFNNDIYKIIEFLHVKPGKGPAFVRTKLKSLTNGKVVDNTFSAGHKIDKVRGMDISIVTSTNNKNHALELLRGFNLPFKN